MCAQKLGLLANQLSSPGCGLILFSVPGFDTGDAGSAAAGLTSSSMLAAAAAGGSRDA